MGNFSFDFIDFSKVDVVGGGFDALPEGRYNVAIDKVELKETRNKTGKFIALTMKVCDSPSHNGRLIWENLNIENQNSLAQNIGRGKLKRILSLFSSSLEEMQKMGPESLPGKKMSVVLRIEEFNGKRTNSVVAFDPWREPETASSKLDEQIKASAASVPTSWT